MKTARHPFIPVHCPYTHQTLLVEECVTGRTSEGFETYGLKLNGKTYSCLDDVIEARAKHSA